MADAMFMPCDDWSEKLATPKEDLTVSDRAALETHLASCTTCLLVNIDDVMISKLIRALPAPDFPPELPPRLLRLREETGDQAYQEPNASVMLLPDLAQATIRRLQLLKEQSDRHNEQLKSKDSTSKQMPSQPDVDRHSKDISQPKQVPPRDARSMEDQILYCHDCNQEFVFTVGEQEFYASRGLTNSPSRCPSCRAVRKGQRGGRSSSGGGSYRDREPRQIYTVICSSCGQEAQVPFQPRGDKPIYCSNCYQAQRSGQGTIHDHKHWL